MRKKQLIAHFNYSGYQQEFKEYLDPKSNDIKEHRDTFAHIAFYVQKLLRKRGTPRLDNYFDYWCDQTAKTKADPNDDGFDADFDKSTLISAILVRYACILACNYDPLLKKSNVGKGFKREEIQEGKSNIKALEGWFIPKGERKKHEGKAISVEPDELEEESAPKPQEQSKSKSSYSYTFNWGSAA